VYFRENRKKMSSETSSSREERLQQRNQRKPAAQDRALAKKWLKELQKDAGDFSLQLDFAYAKGLRAEAERKIERYDKLKAEPEPEDAALKYIFRKSLHDAEKDATKAADLSNEVVSEFNAMLKNLSVELAGFKNAVEYGF
jgi:hypothetical protein